MGERVSSLRLRALLGTAILVAASGGVGAQSIDLIANETRDSLQWPAEWGSSRILDVAVDRDDRLATLVETSIGQRSVLVISPDERSVELKLATANLAQPERVAWGSQQDTLLVLDARGSSILHLVVQRDELVPLTTVSGPDLGKASDLCATGSVVVVFGQRDAFNPGKILHAFTQQDDSMASFGRPFGTGDPLAVSTQSSGSLLCDASERIYAASTLYGQIRAYDQSRTLVWQQSVPDFRRIRIETPSRGSGIRYTLPPDSIWDRVVGLWKPTTDVLAVQLSRKRTLTSPDPRRKILTYFIHAEDGTIIGSQETLPQVLGVSHGELYTIPTTASDARLAQMVRHDYRFTRVEP